MSHARVPVAVSSEIGRLQGVILHTPGAEVESMSPTNAARALYSDILNLQIAQHEYEPFKGVLERVCPVYEVRHLLREVLAKPEPRRELVESLCPSYLPKLRDDLLDLPADELAKGLIEGVLLPRNTLTSFLREERYAIPPLYNMYFTRDASMSIYGNVLLGGMANAVRAGETKVMEAIFRHSDSLAANILDPSRVPHHEGIRIEGGDLHVAREDVLMIGNGVRTSSQGIDFLVEQLVANGLERELHVLVQELPSQPESFIHLDMVFTLLDRDCCMAYAPVIFDSPQFRTIHMRVSPSGRTQITYERDLVYALNKLGMPFKPVVCGGTADRWHQEREQWHSGANFFSFAPGQVLGYARNEHTIAELARNGFEIIPAADIATGVASLPPLGHRCVIILNGSELPRGGGGARCMTMPVRRDPVDW